MYEQNRRAMKSSSRWGNKLDIFQPTTNHLHWLFTQGRGDNLECVSSRVSGRSVGRLAAQYSLVRTCVRETEATHTPTRRGAHAEAQSQLCTPTRTAFIHKSGENGRASLTPRRAAPCFSPRPAFYERSVRCLSTVHNAHARGLRAGERDCVLMAAIAIDARSKFKRTYFPNRGDRVAGAALLLLYLERVSEQPTDVRFRESGYRVRVGRELQRKREIKNREYMFLMLYFSYN